MTSTAREWRSLSTLDLPYKTLRRIGALLNVPHSKNWKDILAMMPEYGSIQMHQLARQSNPTMELLKHMNSSGRKVGQLYDFAEELQMKRICELIIQGLKDKGYSIDDPSARHHSGDIPRPTPTPPQSASAVAEVYNRYQHHHDETTPTTSNNTSSNTDCSSVSPSAPPLTSSPHQIIPFSEFELLSAIGLVGDSNGGGRKLGQGGFGTVYYCQLKINGTPTDAAVKVFSENLSTEVKQQFERELQLLSRIVHPNMIPLLGYSNDGSLCLVYPYLPLGSLDYHLHDQDLGASRRMMICKDIASGLHYLHTECEEVFVHRDVKSANVLLESNWRAKLTDFGVTRPIAAGSTTAFTQTVIGTMVYMAPEYCTGVVSPAVDVYSYGVVLFEVLCGCLAQEGPQCSSDDLLTYLLDNEVTDIVLPCWSHDQVVAIDTLARLCTSNNRYTRPTMEKILQSL